MKEGIEEKVKENIEEIVDENIEEIVEDTVEEKSTKKQLKNKKQFTILGFSIWRLMAYFIIYSVAGFIIETLFGVVTKGVVESRKSFLFGPFCAIYGVGAIIMVPILKKFDKNNYTLFFGGFIIGSIVEYVISLLGEFIFNVKWWDYSMMPFNINGRICVAFSFMWGALAIYLMSHINPLIDRLILKIRSKFSIKFLRTVCIAVILFMFIDFLISSFAMKMFLARVIEKNNIELQTYDKYVVECEKLYENEKIKNFTLKYFSDEKMLKTFPNLKITKDDGKIVWICDLIDIQPYYFRIFTPSILNK